MRAGTCTPSDAGMFTISGTIQLNASQSALGDVVSWVAGAPGRLRITKSSGGRFDVEKTSASIEPSGETVTLCPPALLVRRSRGPPVTGIREKCCSNGEPSLEVSSNERLSVESC